ncbi:signal peptidase II [Pacificibacter marinus]|uniref:Lipoprotein signal peptidase n=1 Tax=Pacificibacter marinus TaxID=658057 RepID=A0A1Y5THG3_9RHOB|nr:signal peptidase II [Pacificibacter marinus]SEL14512.1 signal peptidase II Aspartic peptidase. MEROPS family A08 [Pacificibacter marinus]SLN62140.1 Lipoprotein signal peptidase [Pacificibacter marinus]
MRTTALTALIIFVIDQLSKWVVVHAFNLRSVGEIDVFPPFLVFRMAWNTGINFGLFSEYAAMLRWGWVALAIVMSIWVMTWVRRESFSRIGMISAGLLVGGALGNAIDRILYGAVADFLNTSCCGFANPYSFNVADIAIFAGAFGLILFTGETQKRT